VEGEIGRGASVGVGRDSERDERRRIRLTLNRHFAHDHRDVRHELLNILIDLIAPPIDLLFGLKSEHGLDVVLLLFRPHDDLHLVHDLVGKNARRAVISAPMEILGQTGRQVAYQSSQHSGSEGSGEFEGQSLRDQRREEGRCVEVFEEDVLQAEALEMGPPFRKLGRDARYAILIAF